MATHYHQVVDGEWITPSRLHKMACCDCGLVHKLEFRIVKGQVTFRAWRDKRATAAKRRHKLT